MSCCDTNRKTEDTVALDTSIEGLACYCFRKSQKELYETVKKGRESEFIDDIKSKMKDPGCFCETANPSGKCCLADVKSLVSLFKEKLSE